MNRPEEQRLTNTLENRLQAKGIPVQIGALDQETGRLYTFPKRKGDKTPLVSVWFTSDPSDQEIDTIPRFAHLKAARSTREKDGIYLKDINTIILKKEGGAWRWRHQRWEGRSPWSQNSMPLEELLQDLLG